MEILFDPARKLFHLRNARMSYVMRLVAGKFLLHAYWGARLRDPNPDPLARYCDQREETFTLHGLPLDALPQEYPVYGHGDLRQGALHAVHADGSRTLELRYAGHTIVPGKPPLPGLPAARGAEDACMTLLLRLRDDVSGLEAELSYTIFAHIDALARSARICNTGSGPVILQEAMSACVDFPQGERRLLTLHGAWGRERDINLRPLAPGEQGTGSVRGASSLQTSPFMALLEPDANERQGEVYGFALVYSGNFYAGVSVDQYGMARSRIGIHPFDFAWTLAPGEIFQTPEALLVYSGEGLGGMSRAYHALCRAHIVRGAYAHAIRPMLLNNWEGTYFSFDEERLLTIARAAKEAGVELFVLDDGWFGHRDDDTTSLGDWVECRRKLPGGVEQLGEKLHALGLLFGLWFEPEMVCVDSDLYRAHPDWCLHVPGRDRLEIRHQLTLDMSRADVCDAVIEAVSDVLRRGRIDYVKWDMNRHFQEIGSAPLPAARQQEVAHRYMLGLYRVLETITARFPHILFESCSSGGGRFDLGMLCYMPQTWASDNSDAVARCRIQYGTSLVFPPETMGAHVSAVPNHQTGRVTPLATRAHVAMGGTFGYELDMALLSQSERDEIADINRYVKSVRQTLQFGTFYRLLSPFEGNETAWMSVSPAREEAVVTYVRTLAVANCPGRALRLQGLDPEKRYRVQQTGEVYGGDELMYAGLPIAKAPGDFQSASFWLREV